MNGVAVDLRRLRWRLAAWFALTTVVLAALLGWMAWRAERDRVSASTRRFLEHRVAELVAHVFGDDEVRAQLLSDELHPCDITQSPRPGDPRVCVPDTSVWIVSAANREVIARGSEGVEPPLIKLTDEALAQGRSVSSSFDEGGNRYLVLAVPLNPPPAIAGEPPAAVTGTSGISGASGASGSTGTSATSRAPSLTPLAFRYVAVSATNAARYDDDQRAAALRIVLLGLGAVLASLLIGYAIGGRTIRPLRDVVEVQRGFLADAAHELRTPLSVILASASQALARNRSTEEHVRALSEIRSAAERANTGVTELLEMARMEAGQLQLRLGPLRLDLLAEEVAAGSATDRCTVEALDSDAVVVNADYALLRQAVQNVISNAVKRAAVVRVRTRLDGTWAVIEVSDDGPGFPPEVLPHVFERFRRGERDRSTGTGLGLAIVRSIVVAHGGKAEAANLQPNGAVVRLSLPIADESS